MGKAREGIHRYALVTPCCFVRSKATGVSSNFLPRKVMSYEVYFSFQVSGLQDSVTRLERAMVEAEEDRIMREKNVLATVRSLVADMVKTKRAQEKSGTLDSKLLEATSSSDGNHKNAEDVLATMFSGEKAVALETFFVMMGVLIQQESERLEINQSREGGKGAGFRESKDGQYLSNITSPRSMSYRR